MSSKHLQVFLFEVVLLITSSFAQPPWNSYNKPLGEESLDADKEVSSAAFDSPTYGRAPVRVDEIPVVEVSSIDNSKAGKNSDGSPPAYGSHPTPASILRPLGPILIIPPPANDNHKPPNNDNNPPPPPAVGGVLPRPSLANVNHPTTTSDNNPTPASVLLPPGTDPCHPPGTIPCYPPCCPTDDSNPRPFPPPQAPIPLIPQANVNHPTTTSDNNPSVKKPLA